MVKRARRGVRRTAIAVARKKVALPVKRYVKRAIKAQEETKVFDTYIAQNPSDAGILTDLSSVTAGVGYSQRVGQKIQPFGIRLRLYSKLADTTNAVRYILFRWKGDDTVDAPTLARIIFSTNLAAPYTWQNMLNEPEQQNFRVLMDKSILINAVAKPDHYFTRFFKLKGTIQYDTGVTTGKNHLYLLSITDSGAVSHPVSVLYSRLYYKDA